MYSHDSEWHKEQVRQLATMLRTQVAIDVRFDQWDSEARRDWSQWSINELDKADYVLAIASPDFRARADGRAAASEGRGSQFESAMLRNKMTEDRNAWIGKILPVVLPGNTVDDIPEFLMPYAATHYIIEYLTPDGLSELRRALTREPRYPTPPLATSRPPLPPEPKVAEPQQKRQHDAGRWIDANHSKIGQIVMGDNYGYGQESPG